MEIRIFIVILLNFIIALIGTLAYSVRIVGVRTGKIAVSFALFNVMMLISRTATTFLGPLLTKFVERNPDPNYIIGIFYTIILSAVIANIVGTIMIPTFQRIFCRGVEAFAVERSVPKLIIHSLSISGIKYIKDCIRIPEKTNITKLDIKKLPIKILTFNIIATALITVGTLAPIFAISVEQELQATCITLSAVVNGFATILMSIFIDPHLSILTDDVIEGKCNEAEFRGCIVAMSVSRIIGTILSIGVLVPAAYIIVFIARII